MDALFAKADSVRPYKKRKFNDDVSRSKTYTGKGEVELDSTTKSVLHHTSLPKSLRPGSPSPNEAKKYSHIPDKKLRAELSRQSAHNVRSKALLEDAAFLLEHEESGTMEVEGELEKTAREWAERLATGPTRALALTKQLVNASLDSDRATAFAAEAAAQEINMTTEDAQEGVASFVERRSPEYRGWRSCRPRRRSRIRPSPLRSRTRRRGRCGRSW